MSATCQLFKQDYLLRSYLSRGEDYIGFTGQVELF